MKYVDWQPPDDAGWFQLSGKVAEGAAGDLLAKIINWSTGRKDAGVFVLYLNSYGGNVGDALAIRGSLAVCRRLKHKVVVIILGRASSCAAIIATAADEVYQDEHAWFMIHKVKSAADGGAEEISAEGDYLKRLNTQTLTLIATPQWSADDILAEVNEAGTLWLNAEQAWERGLINGILKESPIALRRPDLSRRKRSR